MNKQQLLVLIKEQVTTKLTEMARIATLVKLSTTDQAELDQMIPPDLKRSSVVKNIIDYFIANNNTPTSIANIAKAYGYPAQQAVNTQFQKLANLGVIEKGELATPKRVVEPKTSRITHQTGVFEKAGDNEKLKYIMLKLKAYQNIPHMYQDWFIGKFGEESLQNLKDLIDNFQNTVTKEEAMIAQNQIRDFIDGLGFVRNPRGRKPINRTLQNPQTQDFDDLEGESGDEEIGL